MTSLWRSRVLVLLVLVIEITHVIGNNVYNNDSCSSLYYSGVDSYLESRFEDCVVNFEGALEKYRAYKKQLSGCRLRCSKDIQNTDYLYPENIENLHFYEDAVEYTLCLLSCKKRHKTTFGKFNLDFETEKLFKEAKPYEYLYICYYQTGRVQKGASAAFTYLVHHPEDKVAHKTLEYLSSLETVDPDDIINLEAEDYVYLYQRGVGAYESKNWEDVRVHMEDSLKSYYQAEEECRASCEGPFNQGWFPDFIPSIANHFTYALRCKQKCQNSLMSINGDVREDLLPLHYHYLQFVYYKLGKIKECCQATASYLIIKPHDKIMLMNLHFYRDLDDAKDEYFKPRDEVVSYMQRDRYEKKLLNFIDTYKLNDEDADQASTEIVKDNSINAD